MSGGKKLSGKQFNMSLIKGKNTKPEIIVRKHLHSNGLRFRLHLNKLPGKPDIVLPKYKTALFVHGCFWHQHENCKLGKFPKKNLEYWIPKLEGNIKRDEINVKSLKKMGWRVIILWECHINSKQSDTYLNKLINTIRSFRLNA